MMGQMAVLEMVGISKSFSGVKALHDAQLTLYPGEVHALLGENGAGKSTLMKIVAGIYRPDSGQIRIQGQNVDIADIHASQKLGISIIHQELCLADNMSVAENIFLGREPTGGWTRFVDFKTMNRETRELLESYGLSINAKTRVGSLTIAQQQVVEIAKALSMNARILIMDEPTASLSNKEVDRLFEAINLLKSQGVAIVYISHRMEEIFEISDRITVMRDGRYIGTKRTEEASAHELIKMMVGRELNELYPKPRHEVGETLFEVKSLSVGNKIRNISFSVRKGEILGFYGLVGSGRTEVMRAIFGIDRPSGGDFYMENVKIKINRPSDAIRHGLALVPENRKEQGGVMIHSVMDNLTLNVLDRLVRGGRVDKKLRQQLYDEYVRKLSIKVASPDQKIGTLSGGNQQKVIIAKWLATHPKLLILDEPTRGIDVGAKKEIYELISEMAAQGISIILVSSELPEILNMSTRVITMREGTIAAELSGDDINQETIITYATGGQKHAG
jgi:ribose transport system ATP-binding protein/inositol transport system ATP-binding protein